MSDNHFGIEPYFAKKGQIKLLHFGKHSFCLLLVLENIGVRYGRQNVVTNSKNSRCLDYNFIYRRYCGIKSKILILKKMPYTE